MIWLVIGIWLAVMLAGYYVTYTPRRRVRHRPDYAKIRRLEIELGMADPPKSSGVEPPLVPAMLWDPDRQRWVTDRPR